MAESNGCTAAPVAHQLLFFFQGCFFFSRCSGHCLSVLDQTYPTETSTPAPELRNTQDAVSDPWVLMNSKGVPIDSVGIVLSPPPPPPSLLPFLFYSRFFRLATMWRPLSRKGTPTSYSSWQRANVSIFTSHLGLGCLSILTVQLPFSPADISHLAPIILATHLYTITVLRIDG